MFGILKRKPQSAEYLDSLTRNVTNNTTPLQHEVEALFRHLTVEMTPLLKKSAKGRKLPANEIDDLTQNVFVKTYAQIPFTSFENYGALQGYIWKVFENDIYKYFRDAKKIHAPFIDSLKDKIPDDDDIAQADLVREIEMMVANLLEWLDEKCRDLLTKKYINDESFTEIAEEESEKSNTIIQRAKRCRDKAEEYILLNYKHLLR